jgi:radical SAM superfamily enzyme YgiQ (UPF0313 family)
MGDMAMGHRIVLTADRTLMSDYNGSMFIGFAACFPRVLPKQLYTRLFCPSQTGRERRAVYAPVGLRKIEAALIRSGIPAEDIAVCRPDRLAKMVDSDTKVVGVTSFDPMGVGPASSTFSSLLSKETYSKYFFRSLMEELRTRAANAPIIVGGPGVWQLTNDEARKQFGISCLVEGEGELIAPPLFKDALEGKDLPSYVTGGPVPVDQIPMICAPTINGVVDISRGCGRGCEFCNPNMKTVRHIPLERIMEEVRTNVAARDKITLHAEDVLRYKAKSLRPDREAVVKLFEEVLKRTENVGVSHIALSSALAEPALVEDISVISGAAEGRRHMYAQTGIETGSPELVSKHMKGKAKPFEPAEWPEVVRESFKLLADNNWIPCGTLVMGMPGERAEDVAMTLDLVRDLRQHKSLIVPLFFVPLGNLKEDEFFRPAEMLPEHWMLLAECIEHDFHWVPMMMDELFSQNRLGAAKSGAMKLAAWYMPRKLRESLELMKAGKDPRALHEPEFVRSEGHLEDRPEEA